MNLFLNFQNSIVDKSYSYSHGPKECSGLLKAACLGLVTFFRPLNNKDESLQALTDSLACSAVACFSFANASILCL